MSIAVRMSVVLLTVAMISTLILSPIVTGTAKAVNCVNTIYVDASRPDDSGNGLSWATAKKHIQSGITLACTGGTVYVAAGVYNQPAGNAYEIAWLDDDLTLIGAGAATTIIDGQGTYRGISITSHPGQINTIRGFTIRNGRGPNYSTKAPYFTLRGAGVGINFPDIRPGLFNGQRDMPDGGGIFITDQHTVTIEDCAIIGNHGQRGGGIYNAGQLTMNRCTIANNDAYDQGGGIFMYYSGSTLNLTNCTISGNIADDGYGGGIHCETEMRLLNCTIIGNSITGAMGQGGGFANLSGNTAYFKNCIVANNIVPTSGNNNGYSDPGGVISEGYNIDSENSCYFDDPTDQINTNPLLGPLQNNGGPTPTCAVTAISPAFNRGTSAGAPATDQRGVARPQAGAYDIGAFELIPAPTVASCSPGQALQGQCPITVVISGTSFDGATSVSFGSGITVNSFAVNSATQITANICIDGSAAPGAYDVSVTTPGGTGTLTGGFTVVPLHQLIGVGSSPSNSVSTGPPGFTPPVVLPTVAVQSASISAKSVTPGTPVTVTADIANKGAVNGIKKVTLYINGQVESAQGVTVNSGSTSKLTFNVSRSVPGDYSVYVDGVPAGSFQVEMVTGSDSILIFSISLIAFALAAGMVMLWRRQRTG
jgi:parallel beta-helix repeat protein